MKKYSILLEQWEQEAYNGGYGADWLSEIGEGIKFFAIECEMQGKQPTFTGLIRYLDNLRGHRPKEAEG